MCFLFNFKYDIVWFSGICRTNVGFFSFVDHQADFQRLLLEGHASAVVRACAQSPASLLRVSHCVYNSRRSGEKDIFTESRNVGQVGARGDPEQGQR